MSKFFRKCSIAMAFILFISLFTPNLYPLNHSVIEAKALIKLNKSTVTVYAGGDRIRLILKGTTKTAKWESNASKIAKVNKHGFVSGVNEGNATVTATLDGKSYQCKVIVKNSYILPLTVSLADNNMMSLSLMGISDNTIAKWYSNNHEVANVDKNGMVTAVGAGKATITAIVGSNSYERDITVFAADTVYQSPVTNAEEQEPLTWSDESNTYYFSDTDTASKFMANAALGEQNIVPDGHISPSAIKCEILMPLRLGIPSYEYNFKSIMFINNTDKPIEVLNEAFVMDRFANLILYAKSVDADHNPKEKSSTIEANQVGYAYFKTDTEVKTVEYISIRFDFIYDKVKYRGNITGRGTFTFSAYLD